MRGPPVPLMEERKLAIMPMPTMPATCKEDRFEPIALDGVLLGEAAAELVGFSGKTPSTVPAPYTMAWVWTSLQSPDAGCCAAPPPKLCRGQDLMKLKGQKQKLSSSAPRPKRPSTPSLQSDSTVKGAFESVALMAATSLSELGSTTSVVQASCGSSGEVSPFSIFAAAAARATRRSRMTFLESLAQPTWQGKQRKMRRSRQECTAMPAAPEELPQRLPPSRAKPCGCRAGRSRRGATPRHGGRAEEDSSNGHSHFHLRQEEQQRYEDRPTSHTEATDHERAP
eukprot:CAMPEP_0180809872 /NCGR_PEP_ID=MMETSP1038_2-20121128/64560_1 /TAXON_ID=632150 /ORGANISM="Azadinium spinosum, Strain 3D9" /LENGTH=282 /DNA_ID=CAMNT_0022851079 /DNA_START=82 /DNA_END=927 /DNA_ORIENTATION=+